jgi:hypothetical protein
MQRKFFLSQTNNYRWPFVELLKLMAIINVMHLSFEFRYVAFHIISHGYAMLINTSFFQIIIHLIFYVTFDHSSYSYSRNANIEKFKSFLEELLLIKQVRKCDICIVYNFFKDVHSTLFIKKNISTWKQFQESPEMQSYKFHHRLGAYITKYKMTETTERTTTKTQNVTRSELAENKSTTATHTSPFT